MSYGWFKYLLLKEASWYFSCITSHISLRHRHNCSYFVIQRNRLHVDSVDKLSYGSPFLYSCCDVINIDLTQLSCQWANLLSEKWSSSNNKISTNAIKSRLCVPFLWFRPDQHSVFVVELYDASCYIKPRNFEAGLIWLIYLPWTQHD